MNKAAKKRITRRGFLRGAAVAAAVGPAIVSSDALGLAARPAPSNRIVMGAIGVGGQGSRNAKGFAGHAAVQMVAVCDVDRKRRENTRRAIGGDCVAVNDFREITRRDDIDAVMIGTPDHWHVLPAIDAARHGKDAYIEKPLTLTIEDGVVLRDVFGRYGRILQTGSQQRSSQHFRSACELVRNGRIGKVHTVRVGIPANSRKTGPTWQAQPAPDELDYQLWQGRAPEAPYTKQRCHYSFRFVLDYSGGQVTNWGAHHIDIAQWGLGTDHTGPVEVTGDGEFPTTGLFTTASRVHFECLYASGTRMIVATGGCGTKFEGDDGWLYVDRGGVKTSNPSLLRDRIGPGEIHLYQSRSHFGNFLDCVRTRRQPICQVEIGHRTASICHLGNIAMLLDRKVRWDPEAERFVNDPEADRMIGRPLREPWRL